MNKIKDIHVNFNGTSVTLAPAGDAVTLASSIYAGSTLINSINKLNKRASVATLFFNSMNNYVMTNKTRKWLEESGEDGKTFLLMYQTFNLATNIASIATSSTTLETITSSLGLYLDTKRDFSKSFQNEFPTEYQHMMKEISKN